MQLHKFHALYALYALMFCLLQDECSFVSLREVSRLMNVCTWFYEQSRNIFPLMDELRAKQIEDSKGLSATPYHVVRCFSELALGYGID